MTYDFMDDKELARAMKALQKWFQANEIDPPWAIYVLVSMTMYILDTHILQPERGDLYSKICSMFENRNKATAQ